MLVSSYVSDDAFTTRPCNEFIYIEAPNREVSIVLTVDGARRLAAQLLCAVLEHEEIKKKDTTNA